MKKDVFNVELSKINDEGIRKSTETILELMPDYFYEIPASNSGRFHPDFSLGEGGLVRHVKVACRIGEELFRDSVFCPFDEHKKDLIRMAIMLHDGFKSGIIYSGHTAFNHPILMRDFILDSIKNLPMPEKDAEDVARMIASHMGPWNKDKGGYEVLPVPKENDELFVHLCDYIASRNFLNVYFEDNEVIDSAKRVKKLEN